MSISSSFFSPQQFPTIQRTVTPTLDDGTASLSPAFSDPLATETANPAAFGSADQFSSGTLNPLSIPTLDPLASGISDTDGVTNSGFSPLSNFAVTQPPTSPIDTQSAAMTQVMNLMQQLIGIIGTQSASGNSGIFSASLPPTNTLDNSAALDPTSTNTDAQQAADKTAEAGKAGKHHGHHHHKKAEAADTQDPNAAPATNP